MKKKLCAALTAALLAVAGLCVLTACGNKDLSKAEITLSQTTYVYDGTAHCPDITVTLGGKTVESDELSVAYSNNINAGTATVTVTPAIRSAYTGSVSADYTIEQAQANIEKEIYLTAEYNQKLGEVLGDGHNIASKDLATDEELNADTPLTRIGDNAYTFRSVYTPDDPNYAKVEQTVYLTVTKATPDAMSQIGSLALTARLGESYSVLQGALPAGVVVANDGAFTNAGRQSVGVTVKQPSGDGFDTEHYETVETTLNVTVERAALEIDGFPFLYDSTAFAAGGAEGQYTLNGSVTLDGQFYMDKDWTVSITFTYEALARFNINGIFDNVKDGDLIDGAKKTDFRFDGEYATCCSWLGSLTSRYDYVPAGAEALSGDNVYLPEHSSWNAVKITIKSWQQANTTTRRLYEIYMGDGADPADGTLLFARYTTRTNPYRLQFLFEEAAGVTVTDLTYTERAYGIEKLFGADGKMAQFVSDGTTVADEYKKGGLMMLGDDLLDYWATNYDKSWLESMQATCEMWKNIGFDASVINLGVGGSTAENWVNYLEYGKSYFEQFCPEYVLLLVGANQLANEDSLNISDYVVKVIERVRAYYPKTKILVHSLMPSTTACSRWAMWNRLEEANDLIQAYIGAKDDENLFYLDFENLFTADRTKPVSETNPSLPEYYFTDGWHFMMSAYEIWTREIMDFLVGKGFIGKAQIAVTVRNEDAADQTDISACVKVEGATSYNGHVVMKLDIGVLERYENGELYDVSYYQVVSIRCGERDVTALYDAKSKTLAFDLEEGETSAELVFTMKCVEDPDDNTTGDGEFQNL